MPKERELVPDVVLVEDLDDLKSLCTINANGCWLTPAPGYYACRAEGDGRHSLELPALKPHRWSWLVSHGLAAEPGVAKSLQIRRTCGSKRCCNPSHLYAATADGDATYSTIEGRVTAPDETPTPNPAAHHATSVADTDHAVTAPKPTIDQSWPSAEEEFCDSLIAGRVDQLRQSGLQEYPDDRKAMAALCTHADSGCWLTSPSPVACRARGDMRPSWQLPKMAAHRWNWMVTYGYSSNPLPGNMFQVRRRCQNVGCCNPEHLFLTAPDGKELSACEAETWLHSGKTRWQDALDDDGAQRYGQAAIFPENLHAMKSLCQHNNSGCWIAPSTGPVACRADGDFRDPRDLPKMAPHRWAWMIANGYAGNPLPGNLFQVRRRCAERTCCNPEHLYLSAPDGEELTLSDARAWLPSNQERLEAELTIVSGAEEPKVVEAEPGVAVEHRACGVGTPTEDVALKEPGQSDDLRPRCWLDAFPWLKGAAGAHALPWWNSPIDEADAPLRNDYLEDVSNLAMERLTAWTIGQIFPGLPPHLDLRQLPLPVRALNKLQREKVVFGADVSSLTLDSMMDWRGIGAGTVNSILRTLADVSTSSATPTVTVDRPNPPSATPAASAAENVPAWTTDLVKDLRRLAYWYTTIGLPNEALLDGTLGPGTPDNVLAARHRIRKLTAADLEVSAGIRPRTVAALFEEALALLDERAIEVLTERVFADEPLKLEELGRQYDVSRERVRQIEGKARGVLLTYVSEEGPLAQVADAARSLIGSIRPLSDLLLLLPSLGETVEPVKQPAWRVLDRLDDAYEIEDGWCVVPTMAAARAMTQAQLQERADKYGVVRVEDLELIHAEGLERRAEVHVSWLTYCGYVVEGDVILTRTNSIGDYAAAILSLTGKPLSTEQIVEHFVVVRSASSLRNAMSTDERFERVDRDRWALREWGIEAYAGIRSLIREQVAAAGGAVKLNELIEFITSRYTVSATSVTAYSSSPPFELREGVVRVGGAGKEVRKTPERTRHMFRRADEWVYRITITKDHLRGSGSAVPVAVASILGLQHGDTRHLPSPAGPQMISWKGTQPALGTIRRILMERDIEAGTEAFLKFGDDGSFDFEVCRPLTGDSFTDVLSLIGAPETTGTNVARAAMATAVGLPATAPTSSLIGAYRDRGDGDIADEITSIRPYLDNQPSPERSNHTANVDEILNLL